MANLVKVPSKARNLLWAEGVSGEIYLQDNGPKGPLAELAQKVTENYRRIKARGYRRPKWTPDELRGFIRDANRLLRAQGYKTKRVVV